MGRAVGGVQEGYGVVGQVSGRGKTKDPIPPRHPLPRLTPLRGRGICGSSFGRVGFNKSATGIFPHCNFIPSGFDNRDLAIVQQYHLIPSLINTGTFPSPGGVSCALHTDGVVIPALNLGKTAGNCKTLFLKLNF